MRIKTKDDPAQWAALINLTKVLNQTPTAQLEKALEPILDIDGALRFLAAGRRAFTIEPSGARTMSGLEMPAL